MSGLFLVLFWDLLLALILYDLVFSGACCWCCFELFCVLFMACVWYYFELVLGMILVLFLVFFEFVFGIASGHRSSARFLCWGRGVA